MGILYFFLTITYQIGHIFAVSENFDIKGMGDGRYLIELIPFGWIVSSFFIQWVSLLMRLALLRREHSIKDTCSSGMIVNSG